MSAATMFLAIMLPLQAGQYERTVSLTFVNQTNDTYVIHVYVPGQPRQYVGTFSKGGTLTTYITVPDADRPITVRWEALPFKGKFTITPDTAAHLRIDITTRGPNGPKPIEEYDD